MGFKRKDGSLDVRWAETAERLQTLADLNFENAIVSSNRVFFRRNVLN